jgi:hypothetical protein
MIYFNEDCKTLVPIEPEHRDWILYFMFGMAEFKVDSEHAGDWVQHVDWIAARSPSPDDWLGDQGNRYREGWGKKPSRRLVRHWQQFKAARSTDSLDEITRQLSILLIDA